MIRLWKVEIWAHAPSANKQDKVLCYFAGTKAAAMEQAVDAVTSDRYEARLIVDRVRCRSSSMAPIAD